MNNIRFKFGMSLMLLIVLLALFLAFFLGADTCQAKGLISTPDTIKAVSQARALQKKGELAQAILLFEKFAADGDPTAMFHAGKSYSRGWGVKPDLAKAEHYFTSAVLFEFRHRGEAAYELGRLYQRSIGPDCNTLAVEWFEKAMTWQFVKASMQLAIHYETGRGVDRDIGKAIKNFEIAAHAGYEQALLKYARILQDGSYGIAQNPQRAELMTAEAMATLERKARAGSASAAKQLGRIYRKGQLVSVDLKKAEKWLLQAARSGSTGGMHDIARIMLADKDSAARQAEALNWLRAAAERGHGGSMTTLGRLHLIEKYDLSQAETVNWFEMGVKAGHGGAMEELAKLYDRGFLVAQDFEQAVQLARMGSNRGHSGCTKLLKLLLAKTGNSANAPAKTARL